MAPAPYWPFAGSQLSAKMPRPSSLNQGHAFLVVVYAINVRITSTSRPAATATTRKIWSLTRPGGRPPLPRPRAAGAGESLGREGAVTAMVETRNLREDGVVERGHGTGGGHPSRARPARGHDAVTVIFFTCARDFASSVFGSGA